MKKLVCLLLAVAMLLSSFGVFAENDISLTVNGEKTESEIRPEKIDGKIFVPLRALCEEFGFGVEWDGETATATVNASSSVEITVGSTKLGKDGIPSEISAKPYIDNGRIFVPLDALAALGASAAWDEESNEVSVSIDRLDGKYIKIVHTDTGKVFSPENGSLYDGAKIVLADDEDSDSQIWKFTSRGGSYMPVNRSSGRTFDISAFSTEAGAKLGQYGINYGDNQCVIPIKNDDGSYLLQCKHSELYLTAHDDGYITQEELVGDETQRFTLEEVEVKAATADKAEIEIGEHDALGGKYYRIIQEETLNAVKADGGEGAKIVLSDAGLDASEAWKLVTQGRGSYALINKANGLALSCDGKTLALSAPDYGEAQIFEISADENSICRIKHTESGLYLTVSGDMKLSLDEASDEKAQSFLLDSDACSTDMYAEDKFGGKYYTVTEYLSGDAVSVENESLDNSAKIVSEEPNGGDIQTWAFVAQGGGCYVITNKASGRSLDVPGGSLEEKASLTQYATNYGDNQVFRLIDNGDGTYMFQNKNSELYLTVRKGYLVQDVFSRAKYQSFKLEEKGKSGEKMIGAAATLFAIKGESAATSAKLQWNDVNGATEYDIYRSENGGEYKFLTALSGNSVDDYDLEIGSRYKYAVYALGDGSLIDFAETEAVEPYALPSGLKSSGNLEPSSLDRPNSLCVDGVYYRYSAWGRDDGGSGFGRLMMTTSLDDITYSEPVEVLNYKEILDHETCEGYESCRFESQNVVYNPNNNTFVFVAHFEADGGYGTAKTAFAAGAPGERFTFYGAINPEGDDTRDLNVYVDDDNSAYLIAAVHSNADLALYKLNEDWTGVERKLCNVNEGRWRELPSMLKVDGIYYLFSSGTAGWYPTQGMYNTATSIEGPWSPLKTVGNTTTFSSQSGSVSRLKDGSTNYIMSTYRWMYYWKDAVLRTTTNRRYPVKVSNGFAFYDFYDELLYSWDDDYLIPVQSGRLLSQGMPASASSESETAGAVNDGSYQSFWNGGSEEWPFSWEVDLGEEYALSEIQISWLIWNGSEPYYQYKIEGSSDGVNYTVLLDKTEGYTDYGFTADELSAAARYVRVTAVNARPRSDQETNNYPAQLYEVKIFGK